MAPPKSLYRFGDRCAKIWAGVGSYVLTILSIRFLWLAYTLDAADVVLRVVARPFNGKRRSCRVRLEYQIPDTARYVTLPDWLIPQSLHSVRPSFPPVLFRLFPVPDAAVHPEVSERYN